MKTIEGFITENLLQNGIAGAFRTELTPGVEFRRATLIVHGDESISLKDTEQVFQYRYKNAYGNWLITRRLYTEDDARHKFGNSCEYEKHTGPFKVPI